MRGEPPIPAARDSWGAGGAGDWCHPVCRCTWTFARLNVRSVAESAKVELGLDWRKNEPIRWRSGLCYTWTVQCCGSSTARLRAPAWPDRKASSTQGLIPLCRRRPTARRSASCKPAFLRKRGYWLYSERNGELPTHARHDPGGKACGGRRPDLQSCRLRSPRECHRRKINARGTGPVAHARRDMPLPARRVPAMRG